MTQDEVFDGVKISALLFARLIPFGLLEKTLPAPTSRLFMIIGPRSQGELRRTYENIMAYASAVSPDIDPRITARETSENLLTNYFRTVRIVSNPTNPSSYRKFGHLEADDEAQPYLVNKGPFLGLSFHTNGDFDCMPIAGNIFNQNGISRTVVVAIGPQPKFIETKLSQAFSHAGIQISSTKDRRVFYKRCSTAFENNGGAVIHADVQAQTSGITVQMLGKETYLPFGIFGLAEKKKVPIVPFSTFVDEKNIVHARIGKPIAPDTPQVMAQNFANQMEEMTRRNPTDVFAFFELELKEARR